MVIEIKYAPDSRTGLSGLADRALAQIEDKGYARAMLSRTTVKVVECGIAFRGRDCAVSCSELLPQAGRQ